MNCLEGEKKNWTTTDRIPHRQFECPTKILIRIFVDKCIYSKFLYVWWIETEIETGEKSHAVTGRKLYVHTRHERRETQREKQTKK